MILILIFFLWPSSNVSSGCKDGKTEIQGSLLDALKNPGNSYSSGLSTPLCLKSGEVLNVDDFSGDYNSFKFHNSIDKPKSFNVNEVEEIFVEYSLSVTKNFKASCSCTDDLDCTCYISEFKG